MRREYKHHKTIADAFAEYNKTKGRNKLNIIPTGSSILTPTPPKQKTYTTICNNGARKIDHYYLGGRATNALVFRVSLENLQFINKHKCNGCYYNKGPKL